MSAKKLLLALLVRSIIASPVKPRDGDLQIASIIASANVPKYTPPTTATREITEWLAIGDSFAAGISADVPNDQLQWSCSRFKKSYPNQMNQNSRLPGDPNSRKFTFGACSGDKIQDLLDNQLKQGESNSNEVYPAIGKPQIGTVSISGNDMKFGDIVNACLYHWLGYGDCAQALKDAHATLDDPGKAFVYKIVGALAGIMASARTANPAFQLYVTGYIRFWDDTNTQCDDVSWAPWYKAKAPITTTIRKDMNQLVDKLNDALRQASEALSNGLGGGVYFVDEFQDKFNGHRFCEVEADAGYHQNPIDDKTWFIHFNSPYKNPSSVTGFGTGSFFDQINSILIPAKDGKSTEDQIKAVDGDLSKINVAYNNVDSMTAALNKLGEVEEYSILPITWLRMMHPKGFGYTTMSDAVIDKVLQYSPAGGDPGSGGPPPGPEDLKCTGTDNTKFMGRDDLNDKIGKFCAEAAAQKQPDKDSASLVRKYNQGTRYEVILSMDFQPGRELTDKMEANCKTHMTRVMDSCDGNDPNNPLGWKHGGSNLVDAVKYNIIPTQDQGYSPGVCSFHLQEDEQWTGFDGPSTMRTWYHEIEKAIMKDDKKMEIGRVGFQKDSGDGDAQSEGDGNPLRWETKLPDKLEITSESQGDYIQFTIGGQSWKTSDAATGIPRCSVGAWSGAFSPIDRNMDCSFNC